MTVPLVKPIYSKTAAEMRQFFYAYGSRIFEFFGIFLIYVFTNGKFYDILRTQQSQLNKRTFLGQENYTEDAFDKNAGFDEPSLG